MLSDEEMEQFFDPDIRQHVIEAVMGEGYESEIAARLQQNGIRPSPYPTLPRELWGVVQLAVPAENESGEDQVLVDANRTTVQYWGNRATPALMRVDYVSLTPEELHHYGAFLTSYIDYLSGYIGKVEVMLETRKLQKQQLLDLLPSYTKEGIAVRERTRAVKADPFVRALSGEVLQYAEEKKILERTLTVLSDRVKQISRDLERRRQSLAAGSLGNHGEGMRRGAVAGHVHRKGR